FIRNFDPKKEQCWIAEQEGEIVGTVFLVEKSKTVAQLRLLLVEPKARGLGIGTRLVSECERFARQAGYRKIVLWTNRVLRSARRIYEARDTVWFARSRTAALVTTSSGRRGNCCYARRNCVGSHSRLSGFSSPLSTEMGALSAL